MIVQPVGSSAARQAGRLDAGYHLAPGQLAARLAAAKAAGVPCRPLGGPDGIASVWSPNRFKRAYAAAGEASVPYLRPYDVFNFLPEPADLLSADRTGKIDRYRLKPGMILQTCSGRNLGPAVMVDGFLSRFVLSHDMIRVEVADERLRLYVLAFLQSRAGQALLRRDMTGSVIDHLSDKHVADQEVPLFADIAGAVADEMAEAVRLREEARVGLSEMIDRLHAALPPLDRPTPRRAGWAVSSRGVASSGRLDAAFHDPLVSAVRKQLLAVGGVRVGDVAEVRLPGRFKREYTVSTTHGTPMVSGAQLLQAQPVNLQLILSSSFDDPAEFELQAGWIAYPADGRAEEGLGSPSFVTADRGGWYASNMVGRVVPKTPADAGWLYLGLKSAHAQLQFKAASSGSVVDHTYPPDMAAVVIPPAGRVDGPRVVGLWDRFRRAKALEESAAGRVDAALEAFAPGPDLSRAVRPAEG